MTSKTGSEKTLLTFFHCFQLISGTLFRIMTSANTRVTTPSSYFTLVKHKTALLGHDWSLISHDLTRLVTMLLFSRESFGVGWWAMPVRLPLCSNLRSNGVRSLAFLWKRGAPRKREAFICVARRRPNRKPHSNLAAHPPLSASSHESKPVVAPDPLPLVATAAP